MKMFFKNELLKGISYVYQYNNIINYFNNSDFMDKLLLKLCIDDPNIDIVLTVQHPKTWKRQTYLIDIIPEAGENLIHHIKHIYELTSSYVKKYVRVLLIECGKILDISRYSEIIIVFLPDIKSDI